MAMTSKVWLLAAALLVAGASADLKLWDQCGGEGGNCKTVGTCVNGPYPGQACPAGSSCLKQSNWYYQCLPTDGYTCIPTAGNTPGAPAGATGGAQYTLKIWDQCGGMGGNCAGYQCLDGSFPNYACPAGNSCQRQNQWYYQCLPGSGGSWSGSGSGSSASTLKLWDQCGGKGGNCASYTCIDGAYPGQSCPSGSTCQRLHEWYSQCRPAGTSYGTCEQVKLWDSCGGLSSRAGANATDGSVCCPAGTTCNFYNIWFWQCQPPGYTAPPEAKKTVTFTVTMKMPGVAAKDVKADALAAGMQTEINTALSADGSTAKVTAVAKDDAAAGRRRRLHGVGAIITFTIEVTIPAGKTAADVKSKAGAKIESVAKNVAFLKTLLKLGLPESLWGLIDALAQAMADSVTVASDGETTYSPSPKPGDKSPAPGDKSPSSSPKPGDKTPSPSPKPGGYGYGGKRTRRF